MFFTDPYEFAARFLRASGVVWQNNIAVGQVFLTALARQNRLFLGFEPLTPALRRAEHRAAPARPVTAQITPMARRG